MNVYILETGCYEESYIVGVFATPEAAMEAWQPKPTTARDRVRGSEYGKFAGKPWSYEWSEGKDGAWGFGADWQDAASVTEYAIKK